MAINSRGFSWNSRNDVGTSPTICYHLLYNETGRNATSVTYNVNVVAGFIPEATTSTYYNYSTSWHININGISSPSFASFSENWTGGSGYDDRYGFQVKGSRSVSLTVPNVSSSGGDLSFSFISTGNGFGTSGDDCTLTNTVNLSSFNTAPNTPSIGFANARGETVTIAVTSTVSDGDSMRRTIQMAPTNASGVLTANIKEICNYDNDIHGWKPSGTANSYNITFSNYYHDKFRGYNFVFRAKSKEYSGGLESGWSEWFGTHTWNNLPTQIETLLPASGIYNTSIPLSWTAATDIDVEDTINYWVQVQKDKGTWVDIISTAPPVYTGLSYNYNISADPAGTLYRFRVCAQDSKGAVSYWRYNNYSTTIKKSTPPTAPTSLLPQNVTVGNSIPFTWDGATDPNGETLFYQLQMDKNGSKTLVDLIPLNASYKEKSYLYDVSSAALGTRWTFRIRAANRFGQTSDWYEQNSSSWYEQNLGIRKYRGCTSPTSISPNSGGYKNSIPVSWTGATNPDEVDLYYNLFVSKNGGDYVRIIDYSDQHSTISYEYDISADSGGTKYKFAVYAQTEFNSGEWCYSTGSCSKFISPVAPSTILPNSGAYKDSIPVSWSAATDADSTDLIYNVQVSKDGGEYYNIVPNSIKYKLTSYSFNISADAIGTTYLFRVKATDPTELSSNWRVATGTVIKSEPSARVKVLYPSSNEIYDLYPRVLIRIGDDPNGFKQKVYVKWGNVEYNNIDNPTLFSKNELLNNGEKIVFKPQISVGVGYIPISARTYNGYLMSNPYERLLNLKDISSIPMSTSDMVNAVDINNIRTLLSSVAIAYGYGRFNTTIMQDSIVKHSDIVEIQQRLSIVIHTMNSWDITNTKFDKPTELSDETFINKNYLEEIKTKLMDL